MLREAQRAVREELGWLELHNFPIYIWWNEQVVDARTLSPEERKITQRARALPPPNPEWNLPEGILDGDLEEGPEEGPEEEPEED